MRDDRNPTLPPLFVLEALRRPRWLQQALLLTPDQRDALWRARNAVHTPRPAPSWAGTMVPEEPNHLGDFIDSTVDPETGAYILF